LEVHIRRRATFLFPSVTDPITLDRAWRAARKGKRRTRGAAAFAAREDEHLARLAETLRDGSWRPGGYRCWVIRRPKPRLIAAAPFADRVVHHAVHRVLAPVLERSFLKDTFACLPGRGTHRAVLAFQQGLRRHRWVSRLDVRRFFLEIEHDRVLSLFDARVQDPPLRRLVGQILSSGDGLYADPQRLADLGLSTAYVPQAGKGLPIGNLTSQLFANALLDAVDHRIKRHHRVPVYVRFMDDLALFGDDPVQLARQAADVVAWLQRERGLVARHKGAPVQTTRGYHGFLGYTVDRARRRVAAASMKRMRARLTAELREGGLDGDAMEEALRAWMLGVLF
jgi:retron-type reverse transcriptase